MYKHYIEELVLDLCQLKRAVSFVKGYIIILCPHLGKSTVTIEGFTVK